MQGRVKNTENLRTCSIVGCVKIDPKFHFLQKFPVFPCFFMILAVLIVSWVQVFHKPKVKDSLHRHLLFSVFLYSALNGKFKS